MHSEEILLCFKLGLESQTSAICALLISSETEVRLNSSLSAGEVFVWIFFLCGSSLIYAVVFPVIFVAVHSSD